VAGHLVLDAGQGRSVSLRGTRVEFKVESDSATGASLTEWTALPGFDTGLHVHENLEETWFVLSGELEFRFGDEEFIAGIGATVFVPPHVPHAFANPGAAEARFLLTTSPPGHDRYFDELAAILAVDGPPDPDAIADLRKRYDTQQIETLSTR
jgi:mannose-6-phosphate isomerase-like protein (cupin superfamily)